MAAMENRRHSREDVVRAALALLDDVGLPDLTMRRLAAELDVQPGALYHHVPNKQTLLAELADRILAARPAPEPTGDWAADVEAAAAGLRDGLLAYRDGAEVVASTLSMGLGADAAAARLRASVARGGFDDATTARAAGTLLHFILGHVTDEQQRMQYDSLGVARSDGVEDDPTAAFAFGIDLIIAGLAARIPATAGRQA